jgi:hypothetical protein
MITNRESVRKIQYKNARPCGSSNKLHSPALKSSSVFTNARRRPSSYLCSLYCWRSLNRLWTVSPEYRATVEPIQIATQQSVEEQSQCYENAQDWRPSGLKSGSPPTHLHDHRKQQRSYSFPSFLYRTEHQRIHPPYPSLRW